MKCLVIIRSISMHVSCNMTDIECVSHILNRCPDFCGTVPDQYPVKFLGWSIVQIVNSN